MDIIWASLNIAPTDTCTTVLNTRRKMYLLRRELSRQGRNIVHREHAIDGHVGLMAENEPDIEGMEDTFISVSILPN